MLVLEVTPKDYFQALFAFRVHPNELTGPPGALCAAALAGKRAKHKAPFATYDGYYPSGVSYQCYSSPAYKRFLDKFDKAAIEIRRLAERGEEYVELAAWAAVRATQDMPEPIRFELELVKEDK